MIETLLGGLLGGIFRCVPEILSFFDKKHERSHELAMQDKLLESQKIAGRQKLDEIGAADQAEWNKGTLNALVEALKGQNVTFQPTGYRTVDFFMAIAVFVSATIRPAVTYIVVGLYCAMKISLVVASIQAGAGWPALAKILWTADDQGILAAILNFWFLGRVFDKARGT